ncbi:Solute carrier family 43 member 3 [Merluccius polli]|uniref:Solute carrier family 43 member 3 n=1 Tax=Merluccius polli TaxID=89951 RepID=A0AA47N681_MERPO|nr:Solute carrier family 43 member 3 [Merluccius polli]
MVGCDGKASVQRYLTLATGLVECLCFAGAVFGWASLVFVLKADGYYSSLCVNRTEVNGTQVFDCSGQDEQLSLVFTIASFMNNFLMLPNGFLFDHFGTTVARLFGIRRMVVQNLFEAVRKSFSMASPNSSHVWVFASVTATAALRLACRYLPAASGVPQAKKVLQDSFFSLTASLTAGVHQRVRGLPPRQAPTTLRPQLWSAALTMEARNMAHSDSMSPASPGDSARRSQQTLTIRLGLPGLTGILPHHRSQLTTRSLYTAGALLVAFSSSVLSVLLFPALSCIAMGGIMLLATNMQVGNLFGSRRSTVITLYNGAFDSSSALFLLMFESGISLMVSFLSLAAFGVIHLLRTFLLLPKDKIPYPLPIPYTYGVKCSKLQAVTPTPTAEDAAPAPPPEKSFRECVLSRFFFFQLLWLSVIQLRHYLFIGTLNPMLQRLTEGDPLLVSRYTNAFAITQLCGVLCAPWNGLILDRNKGKPRAAGESEQESDLCATVLSLGLTALQSVLFSVCSSTPLLPLQYLTFILQVLNRSFLYGGNAAFISIAFPPAHFGKLYGLIMALSALVSLLQYPCLILITGVLGGDPLYVNIALTLLCLLAFIHPIYVYMHCRRLASQRTQSAGASS